MKKLTTTSKKNFKLKGTRWITNEKKNYLILIPKK